MTKKKTNIQDRFKVFDAKLSCHNLAGDETCTIIIQPSWIVVNSIIFTVHWNLSVAL